MYWRLGKSASAYCGIACGVLLSAGSVTAAPGDAVPFFTDDAVLPVSLEAPLTTLMRERSDTEYLDGQWRYTDADGVPRTLDVKLRARGRYRRQPDTCRLPPVRLNFKQQQVEGTPFAGLDKVKLVTHCSESGMYEQNVLKEYLAYRILNVLTDFSFRARLLRIDYVDSEDADDSMTRYGFLIEDDDLLAERIGMTRAELPYTRYEQLVPDQASRVSIFEYLIGNTDFSMVAGPKDDICCHNIVLFDAGDGLLLPIPYDFDFAGLVNARYATPNPRLKIRRVTTRLYRGDCSHRAEVPDALAGIMAARTQVLALVDDIPGMDDRTRDRARSYLDDFYREMADPRAVDRRLLKECS